MGVSTLGHLGFVQDFVFLGQINSCILLWRGASAGYKNFGWTESNGSTTLVEFVARVVRQLLDCPFVFIDIVAEAHLRVDIVSEQVDVCLVFGTPIERRELEQGLLDRAIVIDVNGILEHVVYEVGVRLDEVVKCRQDLQILPLLLMEQVEPDFILVQFHLVH